MKALTGISYSRSLFLSESCRNKDLPRNILISSQESILLEFVEKLWKENHRNAEMLDAEPTSDAESYTANEIRKNGTSLR